MSGKPDISNLEAYTEHFLGLIRDRMAAGRQIGISEANEIDPRNPLDFAREREQEYADVLAYTALDLFRLWRIAARVDAWERQGIARMMRAIHEEHDPA